jgi:GDP-L-fucose synthase
MPTNLYGPGDNFDEFSSHVLPGLIRRFHRAAVTGAPTVTLWGTGTPRREFLHVDDLARACLMLLEEYDDPMPINVGCGTDVTIAELAAQIAEVVGWRGRIEWDSSRPDGAPRKFLNVEQINALGWKSEIRLTDGIRRTYEWFVEHLDEQDQE